MDIGDRQIVSLADKQTNHKVGGREAKKRKI